MKINKIYILFCCFTTSFLSLYAQNEKELITKKIKLEILEKVDQYAKLSGVSNEDEKDEFYRLFNSLNVLVPNDIMPENKLNQKITVSEYADKIPNNHSLSINASIRPYAIGINILSDSGSGEFWVDAIKIISSYDKKGFNYLDTFDIRIIFKVEYYTKQYYITDISLNKERGAYLPIKVYNKCFLKKKSMSLDTILINNKQFYLNEDGQFLIKNFVANIEVKPFEDTYFGSYILTDKDLNFVLSNKNSENYKIIYFRQSVFFIEPCFSINPFSSFAPVSFSNTNFEQNNNFSISYGIKIGSILYSSKKGYWHLITGIKNTNFNYVYSSNNVTESYNTSDPYLVDYLRTNQVSNLQEEQKVQFLSIPLLLEKGFNYKRKYSFYVHAGADFMLNLNVNRHSSSFASYSGYYKDFYGITIKENGVYDYGSYYINNSSTLATVSDLIVMDLGTGLSKKITKKITAKLGFEYQQSFSNLFSEKNKKLSTNKTELNSIAQSNYSFTINYLSLYFGLKYNL